MISNLRAQETFKRLQSTVLLMLNAPLVHWRSRQGFMLMHALLRLAFIAAIVLRFWVHDDLAGFWSAWITPSYIIASILVLLVVLYYSDYSRLDRTVFYSVVILFDAIAINAFLYQSTDYKSELYLLLLLPLILTSHYFPRTQSLFFSAGIIASYAVTLSLMRRLPPMAEVTLSSVTWHWVSRSALLLWATWVYRIQANFPHINERRIVSPHNARTLLEQLLIDFRNSVGYDTISVQILYRGRLQIVACHGFDNPKEICQIEFPANDPRYPNYAVLQQRKGQILDPSAFPSFREPRYHAEHIQTWLGVPLISPATGECFGLVSVDSSSRDKYTRWDMVKANWFAKKVSAFLTEIALGPAALTQATKRENLLQMLKEWAECFQANRISKWEDDMQAADDLVRFGTRIFHVEDCSIYFLKHKIGEEGEKIRVLHLVASSAIPPETFRLNEIQVTGHHGDGLTGLAVNRNSTINYGAEQIKRSPYRSSYVAHLQYLFSRTSRQIMIVPLRDALGKTTGAIKLENRLSWPSEKPFLHVEQHSFEIFAAMVGLVLETIRLHNFADRQAQNIHNLRSIIYKCAIEPIDQLLSMIEDDAVVSPEDINLLFGVRRTVNYTKLGLDSMLANNADNLLLEREGLMSAIHEFVDALKSMPHLSTAAERIAFEVQDVREHLPIRIRIGFYNIARESILNMVRHAGIDGIEDGYCLVSFHAHEGVYHLEIEDNGLGFSPQQKLNQTYSFGLRDMSYQKESIRKHCRDADIEILATPGAGTKIHIWADLT